MKTTIESIVVQNDHGIVPVGIRMPNGDLKRRFLMSLLKQSSVLPQAATNKILLETLLELDGIYRSRRCWAEKALELKGAIDVMGEKADGEVETCEAEKADLCDEIDDLHADMAEMYYQKRVFEAAQAAGES